MPDAALMEIVAISAPWFAAILIAVIRRQVRAIGFLAALISVAASLLTLQTATAGDLLGETLMALFSCITAVAMLVLPTRDCNPSMIAGMLFITGSTLLGYSTDSLLVLLAAWIATTIPFFVAQLFAARTWRPRVGLLLSSAALAAAIGIIAVNGYAMSIRQLQGRSPGGMAVFGLLVLALIFRKGICPAHAWVADAVEGGPAIPTALLLNGHFGAFLVAKLIVPLFPHATRDLFPVLSYLALATALYVAIRALTENSPRRLLAFVALSQSACILAGLESRTAEGITGALVHWFVVTASTMGLFGILRLLEVRFGENLTASRHLGLAQHAPRLAVFFVLFGLALVGLPGTLSFCSQDLLIHGTLVSHPLTGLLLPVAIAMNAVSIFRLFTRLFLGKRRTGFTVMADALPRERWILTAVVLFVVLGGLFPNAIVRLVPVNSDAVEKITDSRSDPSVREAWLRSQRSSDARTRPARRAPGPVCPSAGRRAPNRNAPWPGSGSTGCCAITRLPRPATCPAWTTASSVPGAIPRTLRLA
jgi:NADH-quinone oxidoreductase subunit M